MIPSAGEALHLAGLAFAESLRFWRRVERLRPSSAWQGARRTSRLPERFVLGAVLLGIWILPLVSIFTRWLAPFDVAPPLGDRRRRRAVRRELLPALAGVGGIVAVALIWLVRVPREEAMMVERFGDAYREYMSRTGRLLPKRLARNGTGEVR